MDAATITVVKDGGFFGHPQPDMGNVGYYLNSLVLHDFFDSWSPRCMHHLRILHPSAL